MVRLRTEHVESTPAVDVCIVGAGVVGLALARTLAITRPGLDILLLEKNNHVGTETSSRNSEVIHAGLYYAPDSLKAALCIRGADLLYQYCEQRGIAFKRIGKLIVADQHEIAALEQIQQRAQACGVSSLTLLDASGLKHKEPCVQADAALWSPDTGIVDSHALMQQLLLEAESAGVTLALRSSLLAAEPTDRGFCLQIQSGSDAITLRSRLVINCAGLHAVDVARRIEGLPPERIPTVDFIKGNYLSLSGRSPFSHLIYPVPDPLHRGLGIHATLDMNDQCRFGPDIEALAGAPASDADYAVSTSRVPLFYAAIQRYYPAIRLDRLQPAYSGIRPRLRTSDGKPADFLIQSPEQSGIAGLWQLFGIESPGLTACLALAEHVSDRIA